MTTRHLPPSFFHRFEPNASPHEVGDSRRVATFKRRHSSVAGRLLIVAVAAGLTASLSANAENTLQIPLLQNIAGPLGNAVAPVVNATNSATSAVYGTARAVVAPLGPTAAPVLAPLTPVGNATPVQIPLSSTVPMLPPAVPSLLHSVAAPAGQLVRTVLPSSLIRRRHCNTCSQQCVCPLNGIAYGDHSIRGRSSLSITIV